ncbi:MAG: ABC transporter permease [Micromonosporaceae bacterium]
MTGQAVTAAPLWNPGRAGIAVANEVGKGLRQAWAERVQILIELPLFVAWTLLLGVLIGKGEQAATGRRLDWSFDPYHMTWILLGMVAFTFAYLHVQKMFWRLLGEIQTGTLEQTYLSPLPSWLHVAAGRTAAAVVETAIVVAAMYGITSLFVDLRLTWRVDVLVPLGFLLLGSAGFALAVAGLTLVWKRIEMLNDLLLLAVMFFSGAFLPLDRMPGWAADMAMPLALTHGIAGLRTTMLDGEPIPFWGPGGLAWLTATSVGWLIAGGVAFTLCERVAKRHGSLTRY